MPGTAGALDIIKDVQVVLFPLDHGSNGNPVRVGLQPAKIKLKLFRLQVEINLHLVLRVTERLPERCQPLLSVQNNLWPSGRREIWLLGALEGFGNGKVNRVPQKDLAGGVFVI
jgi:hypothetical protein